MPSSAKKTPRGKSPARSVSARQSTFQHVLPNSRAKCCSASRRLRARTFRAQPVHIAKTTRPARLCWVWSRCVLTAVPVHRGRSPARSKSPAPKKTPAKSPSKRSARSPAPKAPSAPSPRPTSPPSKKAPAKVRCRPGAASAPRKMQCPCADPRNCAPRARARGDPCVSTARASHLERVCAAHQARRGPFAAGSRRTAGSC